METAPSLWHPEKGSLRAELQRGPRACLFCFPTHGVDWAIYLQAQTGACLLQPLFQEGAKEPPLLVNQIPPLSLPVSGTSPVFQSSKAIDATFLPCS